MKFTVPAAQDREQAESVWHAVRDFLAENGMRTEDQRFARIKFEHNGKSYDLSVGDIHPDLGERVCVILKSETHPLYYICTPNRGVVCGDPYLVGEAGTFAWTFEPD